MLRSKLFRPSATQICGKNMRKLVPEKIGKNWVILQWWRSFPHHFFQEKDEEVWGSAPPSKWAYPAPTTSVHNTEAQNETGGVYIVLKCMLCLFKTCLTNHSQIPSNTKRTSFETLHWVGRGFKKKFFRATTAFYYFQNRLLTLNVDWSPAKA